MSVSHVQIMRPSHHLGSALIRITGHTALYCSVAFRSSRVRRVGQGAPLRENGRI